MSSVLNVAQNLYDKASTFLSQLSSSPSLDTVLVETSPFTAEKWRELGLKEAESSQMPQELQNFLNSPCPIWAGKLAKETHIAVELPAHVTLTQLYELVGSHKAFPLLEKFLESSPKTYWFALTKAPLPDTRYLSFNDQLAAVKGYGYEIPKLLETAAAIISAKTYNLSLFAEDGLMTRCEEKLNEWPLAVGSDAYVPFSITTLDVNTLNGYAGVKRF